MAKLISDRTLRGIQTIAERAHQDIGVIVRERWLDNGSGGLRPDPAGPQRTSTPCAISPIASLPDQEHRDRLAEFGSYLLCLPLAADVLATDAFEHGGRRYEIAWLQNVDAFSVERIAVLKEVA